MTDQNCGRLTLDGHLSPTCDCCEEGYSRRKYKAWLELES